MTTQIYNAVLIQRPVAEVFRYACTPAHWPDWHPSSLKLYGPVASIATAGTRFEEDVRAGGRTGHLCWTVVDYVDGQLWTGRASADNGASLSVSYKLSVAEGGTLFERHLAYELSSPVLKFLNIFLLRRRIERESEESLQRLQRLLQAGQDIAPAQQQVNADDVSR